MTRTWHKKPWYKPPRWFKVMRSRLERARAEQAVRQCKDIPATKKHDVWDWT